MKTKAPPFADFATRYFTHLNAPDRPSCYLAYMRAEADHTRIHGQRRYKTYGTFKVAMHRHHKKRKKIRI